MLIGRNLATAGKLAKSLCLAGLAGSVLWSDTLGETATSDEVQSLLGHPWVQVIAVVSVTATDSGATGSETFALIKYIEGQLQGAGVQVDTVTEFCDTTTLTDTNTAVRTRVRELRYLQLEIHSPEVAILKLLARRFAGTVLVTLDVEQRVQLARDPTVVIQARTWGDERIVNLSGEDDPSIRIAVRKAIGELVTGFIHMYQHANN